jgi:hypothetical protein
MSVKRNEGTKNFWSTRSSGKLYNNVAKFPQATMGSFVGSIMLCYSSWHRRMRLPILLLQAEVAGLNCVSGLIIRCG